MSCMEENKITIGVDKDHNNPGKCKIFYNPVMKICRELALCALGGHSMNTDKIIKCLDAFGATGIGGLQWAYHLEQKVQVTVNEKDPAAAQGIKENCRRNKITISKHPKLIQNSNENSKEGVNSSENNPEKECENSKENCDAESNAVPSLCVEVVEGDANIIMHQRQFNFIHLDPFGTTVQFLDAAFRNIYHKGVMVITSTDIATLFGKCPQVLQRNYSAHLIRTDYLKEVSARIVVAAIARAAAKCNKGVEILYCIGVEHFIQVAVRINRKAQKADECLTHIRKVLHCSLCEQWAVYPNTKAPIEYPYSLLPCSCHDNAPGKTAVEMGPMWCGNLFDTDFIQSMQKKAKEFGLSKEINTLLESLVVESLCAGKETNSAQNMSTEIDESATEPEYKRMKISEEEEQEYPMFYYNTHKRKLKAVDWPKAPKLVKMMQESGFRASRTHFDPRGLRTSATLAQLKQIVEEKCKQEPTVYHP